MYLNSKMELSETKALKLRANTQLILILGSIIDKEIT